ncbi:MAG: FixH family protein [Bacteroidales bacterium]|nr:FixH family protein [Bacteroidales bacterium]
MKLKINWGWGIVIFLLIFVGSIAWRIYIASQQKLNLVTPDYYPKGIAYEEEIIKKANYEALNQRLIVHQKGKYVEVLIPSTKKAGKLQGHILVYRPSDFEDDSIFQFELLDTNRLFQIPTNFMKRGLYYIKADWNEDSLGFYGEESIYINK